MRTEEDNAMKYTPSKTAEEEGHDPEKCKGPAHCECRCESCVRYHRYDG